MKKAVVLMLVLMLSITFLISTAFAVEYPRFYVQIDPGDTIVLTVEYSANGMQMSQDLKADADSSGNWYKRIANVDDVVDLEVNYKGVQKEFKVPAWRNW